MQRRKGISSPQLAPSFSRWPRMAACLRTRNRAWWPTRPATRLESFRLGGAPPHQTALGSSLPSSSQDAGPQVTAEAEKSGFLLVRPKGSSQVAGLCPPRLSALSQLLTNVSQTCAREHIWLLTGERRGKAFQAQKKFGKLGHLGGSVA